jgi:hypothetical protein
MEIYGLSAISAAQHQKNLSVKNTSDQNFMHNLFEVAQGKGEVSHSANMQIAQGGTPGSLQFNRRKEEMFDEPFSFLDLEEEMAEECFSRIQKLFKELSE